MSLVAFSAVQVQTIVASIAYKTTVTVQTAASSSYISHMTYFLPFKGGEYYDEQEMYLEKTYCSLILPHFSGQSAKPQQYHPDG